MTETARPQYSLDAATTRRGILAGGLALASLAASAPAANAQKADIGAGPIAAGRDSQLAGKVAVITGSARGIGRAIAVEMAANGADIVAIDICGFVSTASNAKPATPEDLEETARQ